MYSKRDIISFIKNLYPIRLLLLLILIILLGIGFITYKVNDEIYRSTQSRRAAYEELLLLSDFRSMYSLANRDFNEYMVSELQNLPPLGYYFSQIQNSINLLEKTFKDRDIQSHQLSDIKKIMSIKFESMNNMITYKNEGRTDSLAMYMKLMPHYNSDIRDLTYSLEGYEHKMIEERDHRILATQKNTSLSIFGGTIITCIFFLMIFYLLNKEINVRKKVEMKIRQQMQFSERLINSSIDGIVAFDNMCNYTLWNPGMESLTGINSVSVIGKNAFTVFPILKEIGEDKYFFEALKGNFVIAKDRWINFEETEKEFYYEAYYSPIYDASKEVIGGLSIMRNTTQRKLASEALERAKAELEKRVSERTAALSKVNENLKNEIAQRKLAQEQINLSLQEKVILLQEIHHRVKNNLQVISSLLNLQSGYIEDEKSLEVFRESQNRVRSMALIHERLYQSKDLNKIEFGSYINSLCRDLFTSYNVDNEKIKFNSEIAEGFFEIDTAVLCGLIINELISNSLKHAFPGSRNGEVYIGLRMLSKGQYELIERDDGIGFPDKIDFKNTESLGLQLVNILTEQLGGKIVLRSQNPTEFKITFSAKITANSPVQE